MQVVLVRHALPVRIENADGRADPPLSDIGKREADAVGRWLASEKLDAIITSPLRRAVQTAEAIAAHHDLTLEHDAGFAEFDADSSSYIPYEELKQRRDPRFTALVRGDWQALGPEGRRFPERVMEALDRTVAANPQRTVAVVCHGGVINICLARILDLKRDLFFEPVYAGISRIAASRSGIRSVVSVNESGHLRDLER